MLHQSLSIWVYARITLCALLLYRALTEVWQVRQGLIQLPRALVSGIAAFIAIVLLMVPIGFAERAALLATVEVAFFGAVLFIAFRSARSVRDAKWPDDLERHLSQFLPPFIVKLLILDLGNLLYLKAGFHAVFSSVRSSALTYHENSVFPFLALLAATAIVPDFALYWLFIPEKYTFVRVLLSFTELYAICFCLGIYGAMVSRPHALEGDTLHLNFGIFSKASVSVDDIVGIEVLPRMKRRVLRRIYPGAAIITSGDTPLVRLQTESAVVLTSFLRPSSAHTTWFVGSDRPRELAALLSRDRSVRRDVSPNTPQHALHSEPRTPLTRGCAGEDCRING